jgi:uncharacterized protein YdcH (DUF465 family)
LIPVKAAPRMPWQTGHRNETGEETPMAHTPHELAEEFPEHVDLMHRLKTENAHFAKLADAYHDVNRKVHRAETNVEPIDRFAEEELRKKRAQLKDEIWSMLRV